MKAILIIVDGMADRPLLELDSKTPLEEARTPSMDFLAKTGICGIIDPISPGVPPGSDTATFALLGYNPFIFYSGRGALEALGFGLDISSDDVALRCNFATVDKQNLVLDRRAGRIENKDASKLTKSIQNLKVDLPIDVTFHFKNTVQHRAVLVLQGANLSSAITGSDPGRTNERVRTIIPMDPSSSSKNTAEILNELKQRFHDVLVDHPVNKRRIKVGLPPANIVLFRGAGKVPKIKKLGELYSIKSAACIAAAALPRGICKCAGLNLLTVKGATGTSNTDLLAKANAAISALKTADFVFLHIKAIDSASHDGDYEQKIKLIERIDQMLKHLMGRIDFTSTFLTLTADHTTSSTTRNHEGDPVPVAMMGPYIRSDKINAFTERLCACGGLNRLRGTDLMPIIMNHLGKIKKFGV